MMSDEAPEESPEVVELPPLTVGENSYVSLADANALLATRLFSDHWTAESDATRVQALVTATALLDRMRWEGRPLALTQPLAWPRVADRCPPGYPLSTETPAAIVTATVELALHLLRQGDINIGAIMSEMIGQSMTMYFPTIADELPKHVRRLIEPYLRVSSANVAEVRF